MKRERAATSLIISSFFIRSDNFFWRFFKTIKLLGSYGKVVGNYDKELSQNVAACLLQNSQFLFEIGGAMMRCNSFYETKHNSRHSFISCIKEVLHSFLLKIIKLRKCTSTMLKMTSQGLNESSLLKVFFEQMTYQSAREMHVKWPRCSYGMTMS